MEHRSQYSATPSLLGYIYQCRLALLESLKRLKSDPDIVVAIETLDDVVFEKDGSPTEIIQVKHHITRKASLTNASPDLWKTIRIWCDLFSGGLAEENSILCLVTTEESAENSAARHLRIEERNIAEAEALLLQTSQTSSNESNKEGYQKFNSLTPQQRRTLLARVYILDNSPLSKDLQAHLIEELWGHCERQYADQFLKYLEGWWLQRVVAGIDGSEITDIADKEIDSDSLKRKKHKILKITGSEIDAQLDSLREQFKSDSLPIHPEIQSADPDVTPFVNLVFAKQLRLIALSENRIQRAAKNFFKAAEQRSRWVRESLLIDNDLEQYDDILIEEWAIRFDQAKDSLPVDSTSDDQIAAGKKVFHWVEAEANIPIRPSCHEVFITRGTYQMLANSLRVGWHPEFQSRLVAQSAEDNL
ncbi:MAG: ABC-three component system protein [bacterium]